MLKILGDRTRHCDGVTRRGFVEARALGLGGLALADLLRMRAAGAATGASLRKSVILFWLSGGPGLMETWDPKPDAPREFRGPLGAIATSLPGTCVSSLLPEQARRMDRLAILRSVNHGTGDHTKGNHWMLTGYEGPAFNAADNQVQRRPSMGSAIARVKGASSGLPPYIAVPNLRGGFSVLMGCGSMRMGQVIGRSSSRREYVVDRPISPQDVAATVYHHLGIDGRSIAFEDRTGRPTYLIETGEPIRELVG